LGCVYRDIKRKVGEPDEDLPNSIEMVEHLLKQQKNALIAACGFNMRKLLIVFFLPQIL